jgi:hypothetical protein
MGARARLVGAAAMVVVYSPDRADTRLAALNR